MTNDSQTTAWLDQEDAHLTQVVRAHRWAVQYVGAGDGPEEPAFAYTIGLFGLGSPELVVVGLGPGRAHEVLDSVAALVAGGRDLVPGELLRAPGDGRPLLVEQCPNPGDVVLVANRFYQRPPESSVPAHQLTWPHENGLWPWDDGHSCAPHCQPRPGSRQA